MASFLSLGHWESWPPVVSMIWTSDARGMRSKERGSRNGDASSRSKIVLGRPLHRLVRPFVLLPDQEKLAILENSISLARFASISQQHGLVPIVEPEVLMDGNFPAEITSLVTERVLSSVVKALLDHHVFLEGLILKPNMVRSGSDHPVQIDSKEIGYLTLRTLQRTIPVSLPGIAFLSGGLSEEDASLALSEINRSPGHKPWCCISFPSPPHPHHEL